MSRMILTPHGALRRLGTWAQHAPSAWRPATYRRASTFGVLATQIKHMDLRRFATTSSKPPEADENTISIVLQEIRTQERAFESKLQRSAADAGTPGAGDIDMFRSSSSALPPLIPTGPFETAVDIGTELRPQPRSLLLVTNKVTSLLASLAPEGAAPPGKKASGPRPIIYPKNIERLQVHFKAPGELPFVPDKPVMSPPAPPSGPRFSESNTQRIKTLLDSSFKPIVDSASGAEMQKSDVKSRMIVLGQKQPPAVTHSAGGSKGSQLSKVPVDVLGNPIPPESKLITSILTDHDLGAVSVVGGRMRSAHVAKTDVQCAGGGNSGDDDEKQKEREKEKRWQRLKYTMGFLGLMAGAFGGYLVLYIGAPQYDKRGLLILDKYSHLPIVMQYFYRICDEIDNYNKMIKEPSRDKLLPDVLEPPYYQPPYTLVLEFTDLLVHPEWTYQSGWRFKKRPGVDQFLEALYTRFEVVVYTAQTGMTVFPIMEALDAKNLISYKLVRDATNFVDGDHVKDLDKMNRDLSKMVVVDWNPNSVKLHKHNLFRIQRWEGNDDDTTLFDLAAFLIAISEWEVQDVRTVLQYYAQFENPLAKFKENQMQALQATQG